MPLAKTVAEKAEDELLRRKLWLRIARHVVEEEKDIEKYVAGSLLTRVRDMLSMPCRGCSGPWR